MEANPWGRDCPHLFPALLSPTSSIGATARSLVFSICCSLQNEPEISGKSQVKWKMGSRFLLDQNDNLRKSIFPSRNNSLLLPMFKARVLSLNYNLQHLQTE